MTLGAAARRLTCSEMSSAVRSGSMPRLSVAVGGRGRKPALYGPRSGLAPLSAGRPGPPPSVATAARRRTALRTWEVRPRSGSGEHPARCRRGARPVGRHRPSGRQSADLRTFSHVAAKPGCSGRSCIQLDAHPVDRQRLGRERGAANASLGQADDRSCSSSRRGRRRSSRRRCRRRAPSPASSAASRCGGLLGRLRAVAGPAQEPQVPPWWLHSARCCSRIALAVPQQQPGRAEQPPVPVAEGAARPTVAVAAGERQPSQAYAPARPAESPDDHLACTVRTWPPPEARPRLSSGSAPA